MTLRLHIGQALAAATSEFDLPEAAARHARVRRVQPGQSLLLFDGSGLDWPAEVVAMDRRVVRVRLGPAQRVERELALVVTLAFGMPANERMDTLVEKATELGAARLQPLLTERSVLRLEGERAQRRREHWQAVAASACEQCGRARVPEVLPVLALAQWLDLPGAGLRWLLSPAPDAPPLPAAALPATASTVTLLSGPEGGLTPAEIARAADAGFQAVSLGPRILRADTAPLAALAWLALAHTGQKSG